MVIANLRRAPRPGRRPSPRIAETVRERKRKNVDFDSAATPHCKSNRTKSGAFESASHPCRRADRKKGDRCDLRKWLNGAFLETAFSAGERDAIAETGLPANANPRFETPAGNPTRDKVFLLSSVECLKYLPQEGCRAVQPTDWAVENGCYADADTHQSAWWTRTPGEDHTHSDYFNSFGDFGGMRHTFEEDIIGVRPAIWVSREALSL